MTTASSASNWSRMSSPRVYSKRKGSPPIPAGAVYVGRPTKWGNPYVVGKDGTQSECVKLYATWIKLSAQQGLREEAKAVLRGKDLVCWCYPKPCHAEVLLQIANQVD